MSDVGEAQAGQAKLLRDYALDFRRKAQQTRIERYIELMQRRAAELERLAEEIEAECTNLLRLYS